TANDHPVGSAEGFLEGLAGEAGPFVQFDARLPQQLQAGGSELVTDEDTRHGMGSLERTEMFEHFCRWVGLSTCRFAALDLCRVDLCGLLSVEVRPFAAHWGKKSDDRARGIANLRQPIRLPQQGKEGIVRCQCNHLSLRAVILFVLFERLF